MAHIIHFDNDLFFINEKISLLSGILSYEVDEAFFFDRIIEDILFIDTALKKIHTILNDTPSLANATEVYRNFSLTQKRYMAFIETLLAPESGTSLPFGPFHENFHSILNGNSAINDALADQYDSLNEENSSDLVSLEEYQFLLQNETDDE